MARLKASKGTAFHAVRLGLGVAFTAAGAVAFVALLPPEESHGLVLDALAGGFVGFLAGLVVARPARLALCRAGVI